MRKIITGLIIILGKKLKSLIMTHSVAQLFNQLIDLFFDYLVEFLICQMILFRHGCLLRAFVRVFRDLSLLHFSKKRQQVGKFEGAMKKRTFVFLNKLVMQRISALDYNILNLWFKKHPKNPLMALEFALMNKACIIGGYYDLNGSFKLSQRAWNFQKFHATQKLNMTFDELLIFLHSRFRKFHNALFPQFKRGCYKITKPLAEKKLIFHRYFKLCMTEFRQENGQVRITKGCKQKNACEVQAATNKTLCYEYPYVRVCHSCCEGDLCNDDMELPPFRKCNSFSKI